MERHLSVDLQLEPAACILGALAVLVLPLRWLTGAVTAAAFHELCHYAALRLCGIRVNRLSVGAGGTIMETDPIPAGKQLACALAGPAGSLFLLLFARWIPVVSLCGLVQGVYNLLPLYPFDGGRVLRCILDLMDLPRKESVIKAVERSFVFMIICLGLYGWIKLKLGVWVFLTALVFLQKTILRKIPCKDGPQRVQ